MAKIDREIRVIRGMSELEIAVARSMERAARKSNTVDDYEHKIVSLLKRTGFKYKLDREVGIVILGEEASRSFVKESSELFREGRDYVEQKQERSEIQRMVAHELANISLIVGNGTRFLLKIPMLPETIKPVLQSIHRTAYRVELAMGILELSSFSPEEFRKRESDFNLDGLVEKAVGTTVDILDELKIGLKVTGTYSDGASEYIRTHRPSLGVVIGTLVGNIANHTPEGNLSYMDYEVSESELILRFENLIGPRREGHGLGTGRGLKFVNNVAHGERGSVEDYREKRIDRTLTGKVWGYQEAKDENPNDYDLFGIQVKLNIKKSSHYQQKSHH